MLRLCSYRQEFFMMKQLQNLIQQFFCCRSIKSSAVVAPLMELLVSQDSPGRSEQASNDGVF